MSNNEIKKTPFGYWWTKRFEKIKTIKKDTIGVYQYTYCIDTINEASFGHKYNVYAKVKAVHVYDNLVEVEVISIKVFEQINPAMLALITESFTNYIDPKYIKWEAYKDNELIKS
jgi:hypothetical protein